MFKILTNNIFLLNYNFVDEGLEFIYSYDANELFSFLNVKPNLIILSFSNILGSSSIHIIKKLTRFVEELAIIDPEIPLIIIGIGSNVTSTDFDKFKHEDRDFVIKKLRDSLSRIKKLKIFVRGDITHKWLLDYFSFSKDIIEFVNYKNYMKTLSEIGGGFLGDGFIRGIINNFIAFNSHPANYYNPFEHDFVKQIVINISYITHNKEEKTSTLNSDVFIDGAIRTIKFTVDDLYADYFDTYFCDAFLLALIPFSMRSGHDIVCKQPVTEEFLHNLNEILIPNSRGYGRLS